MLVPRKFLVDIKPVGSRSVTIGFLGGSENLEVDLYDIAFKGLLVQDPPSSDVFFVEAGRAALLRNSYWHGYCRWHNGPLGEEDDASRRLYCPEVASGYCRRHKRTLRSLYDTCFGGGERTLWACRAVDEALRVEYSLYLAWWPSPSGNVKVGVTRRFRLHERLAEQPHVAATEIAVFDSALKAREAEIAVSKSGIARQASRRNTVRGHIALPKALAELEAASEKASRLLGLESDARFFSIKAPHSMIGLAPTPPDRVMGRIVVFEDYWGGMVLARAGSTPVVLKASDMLHKASIESLDPVA